MIYQNLVRDFAKRTLHNLQLVREKRAQGTEAYEVTQLINSMLGLLVLPKEHYYESIPTTSLDDLRQQGWPEPVLEGEFKKPKHLRDLLRLLRNSVAHFNVEFTETDEQIDGVILSNKCNCGKTTWQARLTLAELEEITKRFIDLILNEDQKSEARVSNKEIA
jgi:HEPN pEK499 p136